MISFLRCAGRSLRVRMNTVQTGKLAAAQVRGGHLFFWRSLFLVGVAPYSDNSQILPIRLSGVAEDIGGRQRYLRGLFAGGICLPDLLAVDNPARSLSGSCAAKVGRIGALSNGGDRLHSCAPCPL